MISNINPETGIHYGVCNGNEASNMDEYWFDLFTPVYFDENCEEITEFTDDMDDLETDYWKCDTPDFKAEYNSNTNIIMIFYSKKTVRCAYCSPCYPNAGDLGTPDENGIDTYTFND